MTKRSADALAEEKVQKYDEYYISVRKHPRRSADNYSWLLLTLARPAHFGSQLGACDKTRSSRAGTAARVQSV